MNRKINKPVRFVPVIAAIVICVLSSGCSKEKTDLVVIEYAVTNATIKCSVVSVGTIEPQNRLELNPPINGRVDQILVEEGDKVKKGQIVAWLSSTDRAAVLDAASTLNKDEQDYWKSVYKATPIIASIDGEVIARRLEPGQTVTMSTPIIVISDRLIVRVRVDETDIGKVKLGMNASIKLDAYPDIKVKGKVDRISYESKLANNVVVYEVEVVVESAPDVFRSGMSVEVSIYHQDNKNVLAIPFDAVSFAGEKPFVLVKSDGKNEEKKLEIELGVNDSRNYEVTGGLKEGDVIVVRRKDVSVFQKDRSGANNPFMPMRKRKSGK